MVTTRRNSDDDVPNFKAMINAAVANALPNLTTALRTQITNDIRNGVESSGGGGGGGDAIPQGIHVWIEMFTKLKLLAFRSTTTFAKKLNMTPTPLIERVIISTPMKNHMLIDYEYVNCPIRFDDRVRPVNLLPIHMFDFDVILGMEWLASHRATIDCYARTVMFDNVRQPEFVYHGSSPLKSVKLISAMKARTLISHGCQGFLASIMDTSLEGPNIENLSGVREFADVFVGKYKSKSQSTAKVKDQSTAK
ncbi:putative reverse transcriptase domain-containing protein [Tanacetum coccineum]